ncbi:ribokinase [Mycetocola sp. CAN_C7]|uniref:ribokinase n=1 Tax=Mycetocola sp. CAN_C7 TaxID=2787724 RepID=UPI0018CAF086
MSTIQAIACLPSDLDRRVLVVGSVNQDIIVRTARQPSPGETVTGVSLDTGLGGKGLNQAVAAARAGATVLMVGAVGDDAAGAAARNQLSADGISTDRVLVRSGTPTGSAVVTVDDTGENSIIVVPGANGTLDGDDVRGMLTDLRTTDILLLQNELPPAAGSAAARAARAAGATVVWNAAPAPITLDNIPDPIDVLIVNVHELVRVADLLGVAESERDSLAATVGRRLNAVVVCTLGGDGSMVFDGGRHESVAAVSVDVVDTTAAGDTFIGYLASKLPFDAISAAHLRVAGAAAGLTVTRPGASDSIPYRGEVNLAAGSTTATTTWSTP